MTTAWRVAALVTTLAACGDGDGPPGSSLHPTLASCFSYRSGTLITCTEYRNITDADWAPISQSCSGDNTKDGDVLREDETCGRRNVRGSCRTLSSGGMTTTKWFSACSLATEPECDLQPSAIQSDCESSGGSYQPPDEAGLR